MKKHILFKIVAGLCLLLAGVLFVIAEKNGDSGSHAGSFIIDSDDDSASDTSDDASSESLGDGSSDAVTEDTHPPNSICVHVCGAVNNPGVYYLAQDSRIEDAIESAGGFSKSADKTYLNLAQQVTDGQQIKVPTTSEAVSSSVSAAEADAGIVNINTADADQLKTLSGIGDAKAEAIIAYRDEHGGFKDISEITQVSGIGDSLYSRIKSKIKV